jgi:hypothetical protein
MQTNLFTETGEVTNDSTAQFLRGHIDDFRTSSFECSPCCLGRLDSHGGYRPCPWQGGLEASGEIFPTTTSD